ncbi:ACP S-malonyltransferase [Campylobacter hominis]|uniref:ACP S-malonyltransferase n=1 Tax=Campylobacter hominis TaxID=76517 RepID=UPI00248B8904|nr:ACP S-malonyltransferase [Campylobacter hominis]
MKYAFIFPGQGSQSVGMGREFYENFIECRELLDESSEFCKIDFKNLLFSENEKLNISEFTQPAIVLNSFMAFLALQKTAEISPVFSLGHSLGEFSALGVNKALDFKDAIKLVNIRGKLMQEACEGKNASMMVVIGLDDEKVTQICKNAREDGKSAWAANFNCDGQIVVAGNRYDLSNLESEFKAAGAKRAMLLNMSVASHCPILESAAKELVKFLKPLLTSKFAPVVSNVTSQPYSTKDEAISLLKEQLILPVLYKQSILNIEDKVDCFVEFGAGVLKGINRRITKKPTFSINDLDSLDKFLNFRKENL